MTTLTGLGGVGKTRIALQVAEDLVERYADGVFVVDLASLPQSELVGQAIADVLGVREEAGRPVIDTLAIALQPKHRLLVLDNCEHVLEGCVQVVDRLIQVCPDVDILVTSREPLRVAGERTFQVPPLQVADPRHLTSIEELRGSEAVRLFGDRAQAAQSRFAVTENNAAAVAEICVRLDGIPLAIELAAARVRALTPAEIAQRLNDRFRLLTTGSRAALPRQQTLRSLVDWSYETLSDTEQVLFRRIAVFAGGWTLDAAEAVCAGPPLESIDILDFLSALVDKSLVVADEQIPGQTRYRLLETLREYANERLTSSGERESVMQRHAAHYMMVFEMAEPQLSGPDQAAWLERLQLEHDNLRTALQHAADSGQIETGLRLASASSRFWATRYIAEGGDWLSLFLCDSDTCSAEVCAKALNVAGILATASGDLSRAVTLLRECVDRRRSLGEPRALAVALNSLGGALLEAGERSRARPVLEESLELRRRGGDEHSIAIGVCMLAELARRDSDLAAASQLGEESRALARRSGDKAVVATATNNLGAVAISRGQYERAETFLLEAVSLFRELGNQRVVAECLQRLAQVAGSRGHAATAARLLGAAVALRNLSIAAQLPDERAEFDRSVATARSGLDAETFESAFVEGQTLSAEQAIAVAQTEHDCSVQLAATSTSI